MPPGGSRSPGWGALPEDLVCSIAALLPVRERFGALPLLNRHFYAISQRWPVQCGVYELAEPAKCITEKGIERRCQQLLAWLGRHKRQLQLLRDDIPGELQAALDGRRQPLSFDCVPLLALLQPTVAAVLEQYRGALVSLSLWLPDPPMAPAAGAGAAPAAGGGAAQGSPLEGHTSLSRLQLSNFRGNAAGLAALLEPAAQLAHLHLVIPDLRMHPELLAGVQAQPALCHLLEGLTFQTPAPGPIRPGQLEPGFPEGLLGCTAVTTLKLQLAPNTRTAPASPPLPPAISRLSRLACLQVAANWECVPDVVAKLPLTSLELARCKLGAAPGAHAPGAAPFASSFSYTRSSGMPRSLRALAPTLKKLTFFNCVMTGLPIVVSSFTGLTCLSLRYNRNLHSLPPWLGVLTGLQKLKYLTAQMPRNTRLFPDVLDSLPSLQCLIWTGDSVHTVRRGSYLSRLTRLSLGTGPDSFLDPPNHLDVSALGDATVLLDLSLPYHTDEAPCALFGATALAGLPLTRLTLSHIVAEVLPPPGPYLATLQSLILDGCKAVQLAPGLAAATGLTEVCIVRGEGLHLDDMWVRLTELLPCWPLLKEVHASEGRGDEESYCQLLTGELLADMGLASSGESEEEDEA